MRCNALSFFALCLVHLTPFAAAVLADDAYRVDYHHALLGTPQRQNTFFHRPTSTSKASLLYTLSEKLVLGAVNPKDGAIIWRQYLDKSTNHRNADEVGILKAGDGEDIVVSAVGSDVQAWDAADGKLVWEWKCRGVAKSLSVSDFGEGKDVLVACQSEGLVTVTQLKYSSGILGWEYKDESGNTPIAVTSSTRHIYYVSLHSALLKGFKISVVTLDSLSGLSKAQISLSSDGEVADQHSVVHVGVNNVAPLIVWADKALKTLKINVLGSKSIHTVKVPDHRKGIKEITIHAPQTANARPHFLVQYQAPDSHWAEVYHVDVPRSSIIKAYSVPTVGGHGAFSLSTIDANVYFTRNTDSEVSLVSSVSEGILERWPVRSKSHGGLVDKEDIVHAASEVVPRGGSSFAVRSATVLGSGNWELVRNGDSVWVRHESIAGIVAAAWTEISTEGVLAQEILVESHHNMFAAYMHRIRRHGRDLKYFPDWVQKIPGRLLTGFLGTTSSVEGQDVKHDGFGFRKVIVVATDRGRVVALDSGAGQVIWSKQAVQLPPGTTWNVTSIEIEDDTAMILASQGDFVLLSTTTGDVMRHSSDANPTVETFFSITADSGRRTLIPIFTSGVPGRVTPGISLHSTVIVTQRPDGTIAGWNMGDGHDPVLAWEFAPYPGETISSVTVRPAHDPVASIGEALGDRNVLYKFLSPNLILVTAVGSATATASLYLLDSISGQTLYTTSHTGIDPSKPIPVTFAENWFAYSLFADSSASVDSDNSITTTPLPKAYQLIVSKLYESPFPNDRGSLGSNTTFSSLDPASALHLPHVLSTSYIVPAPITHLTTTSTLQGITPRSLLALVPSLSAILSIPAPFLSPRRPVDRDPRPTELEEGLFRYSAVLEFNAQWLLTHQREVVGLRRVLATPSLMESTSLVFGYGRVDVFGTRVSPIGAFDTLGRGFGRLQLVGTVVALAVGTGVLAPMVRKKQIDGLWI